MRIGIDFDDTIHDFAKAFLLFFEDQTGKKYTKDVFCDESMASQMGLTKDELFSYFEAFNNHSIAQQSPPFRFAQSIIPKLAKEHDLFLITGRHKMDGVDEWINFYFPDIFKNILQSRSAYGGKNLHLPTKEMYCSSLKLDLFIDDDPNYVLHITKKGHTALMLTHPWNKQIFGENIIKVNDWKEIQAVINKRASNTSNSRSRLLRKSKEDKEN